MHVQAILLIKGGGGFKPTKPRGLVMGSKGVGTWDSRGWLYNLTRWDHEGGHVGLLSSLGLVLKGSFTVGVLLLGHNT